MTVDSTTKPKKELILNILTNGTPSLAWGLWKHPDDYSREARNIDFWVKLAKTAERGKLHGIFIADHLVYFNSYKDSWKPAVEKAVFSPRISTEIAVSAMASVTKSLGFGITFSTVSEHPYHFARRIASLDQLTGGRMGWNVVSSYLKDIGNQLLNGEPLPPHDDRYQRTQEYLDALYELLLSSWRDDALKYDKESGIFADPDLIRNINFKGEHFDIEGPSITEPTVQRFPVIFQAGTSTKGKLFAAENAEFVFLNPLKGTMLSTITEIKETAKNQFGRNPDSLKFITSATVVLGKTTEEAKAKIEDYEKYLDKEAGLVVFSGYSGIDLDKYDWDEQVVVGDDINGGRSMSKAGSQRNGQALTKRQILENASKLNVIHGTAEEVADALEDIALNQGVDGFNFITPVFPQGLDDIVDLLVPELQKRGLFHRDYTRPGGTLRENSYQEAGQNYLPDDHPAAALRWDSSLTLEEFEAKLHQYKAKRDETRKTAHAAFP
jgi:FMN-dependent oxidoreductase (nitrilotriacetate monooxygenase family)